MPRYVQLYTRLFSTRLLADHVHLQYKIGVKVLIINNNFQGMVRQWQDLFYDSRYSATEMVNPDFAALAVAMGAKGLTTSSESDLETVMREFLFADPEIPTVLNAICETDEHVFPMVPAGHALDDMVMERPAKAEPAT